MRQIFEGLADLHDKYSLTHRAIRPENLLFENMRINKSRIGEYDTHEADIRII